MSDFAQAEKQFADFHGREPDEGEIALLETGDFVWPLGRLHAVSYAIEVDGKEETYYHEFNTDHRPVLSSSSDGKQLYILAGEYDVSEKGIVG